MGGVEFLAIGRGSNADEAAEILNGRDRFKRTGDHLASASSLGFLGQLGLEQLGVGEDDPQLVVEPVEDTRKFRARNVHDPRRGGLLSHLRRRG